MWVRGCMGAFTVINLITFLLIVPKWSLLKTTGESSAASNYVLIIPVTDTELEAVEVTDARNVNADIILPFVTKQLKTTNGQFFTAQDKSSPGQVIYSVVLVKVNGFKCHALLDTGVGSSYASSAILGHLGLQPVCKEFKRIEMMLGSVNTKVIGVYNVTINSLNGKFRLETKVTKVDRGTLLSLDNPRYAGVIDKYPHLTGVHMIDGDKKAELPAHIILGASDYAKIRIKMRPKIGHLGEPVAELTQFGWTITSPGKEIHISHSSSRL